MNRMRAERTHAPYSYTGEKDFSKGKKKEKHLICSGSAHENLGDD
jgi:hypothetical protein